MELSILFYERISTVFYAFHHGWNLSWRARLFPPSLGSNFSIDVMWGGNVVTIYADIVAICAIVVTICADVVAICANVVTNCVDVVTICANLHMPIGETPLWFGHPGLAQPASCSNINLGVCFRDVFNSGWITCEKLTFVTSKILWIHRCETWSNAVFSCFRNVLQRRGWSGVG